MSDHPDSRPPVDPAGVQAALERLPGRRVEVPRDVRRYLEWTLALAPEITVVCWFEERRELDGTPRLGARTPAMRCVVRR